jgi:hypothetical protein
MRLTVALFGQDVLDIEILGNPGHETREVVPPRLHAAPMPVDVSRSDVGFGLPLRWNPDDDTPHG